MKITTLSDSSKYYIRSPRALIGTDLTRAENILIEVFQNKVVSIISGMGGDNVPAETSGRGNLFSLEEGLTLLPCLIDAHVHLALNGGRMDVPAAWHADEGIPERVEKDLNVFHERGIGVVRDGGDSKWFALELKNLLRDSGIPGPEIVSTGQALRKKGGYGSFLGGGYSRKEDMGAVVDNLISAGADQLKVLVSGIVSFKEFGKVEPPAVLARDELQYLVARARMGGIRVMAHASSPEAVDLAVRAGVDSIEHGYFLSRESLKKMASQLITWIPTIVPVAARLREPFIENLTGKEIDIVKRVVEQHMENLHYAWEIGVPVGMGTDSGAAGVKHGLNLSEEMRIYSQAGLSNKSILKCAIVNNAGALGLKGSLGSIEVNRKPWMMAVKGDPLTDLDALDQVRWLFLSPSKNCHNSTDFYQ